ncbi:MAG: hypothetical protein Q4G16_08100 [Cruoricaptor ignavus]|nr:hypothetical protein [Cruoricaptor ignavus]
MQLKGFIFLCSLILFALLSCNRDEIKFDSASRELRFSRDTLVLDTVYNQVRSETYAVKVYNQEDKDIKIPNISLQGGSQSPYRLNVDGQHGTTFSDVPLRKNDSLYIFVEIAPIANATEAIAEDRINFSTNQHITLLSVVQDAEFYIKTETNPNIINQDIIWTNDKAKIIYGDITLAEGKMLTVEKGTKVYFHKNSGLKLSENSILNVNGDLGEEVVFRGDRNDARHDTIALNWKGIAMEKDAVANINYARIFGGTTGLEVNHAKANIQNTIIHTFQEYGINAINAEINASNLVMNNCGIADFGISKGGNITLSHCTLANYWSLNSAMSGLAMSVSNEWTNADGNKEFADLYLDIRNSILYTRVDNALVFNPSDNYQFNYSILNSLLKFGNNAGFDFDNNSKIINSIKNEDPLFLHYYTRKMNLRTEDDSPTKGKANLSVAQNYPWDLVKVSRTQNPSIGAYQ